MKLVEGHGGFSIAVREDGEVKLNDPNVCEALGAAVRDIGGAIVLQVTENGLIRASELYSTLPERPGENLREWIDNNTATFGVGKTVTEALRYLLGYFWIKGEDMP